MKTLLFGLLVALAGCWDAPRVDARLTCAGKSCHLVLDLTGGRPKP